MAGADSNKTPEVLLDDAQGHRLFRFVDFVEAICAHTLEEIAPAFAALKAAQSKGLYAAGYCSYELGYLLEPKLAPLIWPVRKVPLLWFGLFRNREEYSGEDVRTLLAHDDGGRAYAGRLVHELDAEQYGSRYRRIKDYIAAGDAYQVNLTFRSRFTFLGNARALYRALRDQAHASYGAYIDDGSRKILSLSPESFFTLDANAIVTRPMKGTAPRGKDAAEDAKARDALQHSEKAHAENLMIVDLLRNDLSRLAEIGSVKTEELFAVETYPTLHQMVSIIRAKPRVGIDPESVFRALFPCGSVTGAPKIRAMEIIRECEISPRGVYCGAIGYFAPNGDAAFNVAIRTLTINGGQGELGIGGGIVQDSQEADEYDECLVKALFYEKARTPIGLIETLRYEPKSGFVNLNFHLDRMENSAKTLGLPFDRARAEDALAKAAAGQDDIRRARLTLDESGAFEASTHPLTLATGASWKYAISPHRVRSADALSQHKTNWRQLYDGEHARLARETGVDEVLFLNEKDEIVEGSRSNVFLRIGGELQTPPLSSGALNGCLRRVLLAEPGQKCQEAVLTLASLDRAEAVYFGNSLRGLIHAEKLCLDSDPPQASWRCP